MCAPDFFLFMRHTLCWRLFFLPLKQSPFHIGVRACSLFVSDSGCWKSNVFFYFSQIFDGRCWCRRQLSWAAAPHALFLADKDAYELLTSVGAFTFASLLRGARERESVPRIYVVPVLEALSIAIANYKQCHLGRILILCFNKVPSIRCRHEWGGNIWRAVEIASGSAQVKSPQVCLPPTSDQNFTKGAFIAFSEAGL
jgi:hypothetical protein